ncbi:CsbD family protein [Paraburkholderia phymatum]|uniref:CsbD family protein n=1 Tax=Paraburkholderia phymatum (strain DSM 17167 / CIP 108236 / LMG 21445 / STM815) TaxID=391038 RepID=B2JUU9_PARP8|nr:CsbD family protein [Paraburkholderia phymatum]ACC74727.1 CsbD family protein [Paraburkholderia phymatum STM815]
MNRDQLKGVAQQVRGKVNEVVGKATGNRRQQLKGDLQQATGTARKAYGDGKAKIRKLGR